MATVWVKNSLRNSVEAASGGKVTVLYDDKDNPSYMRRFPPMKNKDLYRQYFANDDAWNASVFKPIENEAHPAFIKDGTQIRELLVGQYLACIVNSRACSLPGMTPWSWPTYDNAFEMCKNKGPGWAMNTIYIWGFLQALCLRQKYQPRGNTYLGQSYEMSWETGLREDSDKAGIAGGKPSTKTGTGPASWNHDGTETGVADLVGNLIERVSLMKLVDGKIIMPEDNNTDLAESAWSDTGARFDATTGTADGSGMEGDGASGAPVISDVITKYSGLPGNNENSFKYATLSIRNMTKKTDYMPPVSLILAGLAPITHYNGAYEAENALKGLINVRNYGERMPLCGGNMFHNLNAGMGMFYLNFPRTTPSGWLGVRPVFLLV